MTFTVLITGANRGIGLELTRHYCQQDKPVLACCRNPQQADELRQLTKSYPSLQLQPLDITEPDSIDNLTAALAGDGIDLLINNAGIYGPKTGTLEEVDFQAWPKVLHTNCIAPLQLTRALLPNLRAAPTRKIAFLSSKMGSMSDNGSGGAYLYRSSKAALNAVIKSLSVDLAAEGFAVVALHPGWVQTAMGGPNALISTAESVKGMTRVIDQLNVDTTGRFVDYLGREIPW